PHSGREKVGIDQEATEQTGRRVVGLTKDGRISEGDNAPWRQHRPRRVLKARHWSVPQTHPPPLDNSSCGHGLALSPKIAVCSGRLSTIAQNKALYIPGSPRPELSGPTWIKDSMRMIGDSEDGRESPGHILPKPWRSSEDQ